MSPCGKAIEIRTRVVGKCEVHREERDVLEEMRGVDECGIEEFGALLRGTIVSRTKYCY